jgi:hypothetical protein
VLVEPKCGLNVPTGVHAVELEVSAPSTLSLVPKLP